MGQEVSKRTSLKVRHPQRPLDEIEIKGRCPQCGSLFITERECESCSYQFWVDLLGEPFGERSFFEMESDYNAERGFLERLLPKERHFLKKKHKRYLGHLKRRFEILTDYFSHKRDRASEKKKELFFLEAKLLIEAYAQEGGDLALLSDISTVSLKRNIEAAKIRQQKMWGHSPPKSFWPKNYLRRAGLDMWLKSYSFPIKLFFLSASIMCVAMIIYAFIWSWSGIF